MLMREQGRGTDKDKPSEHEKSPASAQMTRVRSNQEHEKRGMKRGAKVMRSIESAEAIE
jgi:hypothetical protein